jgi:hypothetical protein
VSIVTEATEVAVKLPKSATETLSELPAVPGYLAANGPTEPSPAEYDASYSSSFLIRTAVPDDTAFLAAEPTSRETSKLEPYAKKDAAVRKSTLDAAAGLPKRATSSFSLPIDVSSRAGPHAKSPTKPPVVVPTPGTTLEASCSRTRTPGLS